MVGAGLRFWHDFRENNEHNDYEQLGLKAMQMAMQVKGLSRLLEGSALKVRVWYIMSIMQKGLSAEKDSGPGLLALH